MNGNETIVQHADRTAGMSVDHTQEQDLLDDGTRRVQDVNGTLYGCLPPMFADRLGLTKGSVIVPKLHLGGAPVTISGPAIIIRPTPDEEANDE